jgi:ribosomal protein L13E
MSTWWILVSTLLTRKGAKGRRFSLRENLDSGVGTISLGVRVDSGAHRGKGFSIREILNSGFCEAKTYEKVPR